MDLPTKFTVLLATMDVWYLKLTPQTNSVKQFLGWLIAFWLVGLSREFQMTMRGALSYIYLIFLTLTSGLAWPSDPSPIAHERWSEGRKIVASQSEITFLGPGLNDQSVLKAPANCRWTCYGQGFSWALEQHSFNEDDRSTQRIWRSVDSKTWELFGELPPSLAGAVAMVPLKEGRLLMVPFIWHWYEGQISPLYTVRRAESGSLVYHERVMLDLGEPFTLRAGHKRPGHPDLSLFEENKKFLIYKNIHFEAPIALCQVGEGFFLFSRRMGVFWYFDGRATLKQRFQLYKHMKDEDFAKIFNFERSVLACQVSPEQKLIVISRSKEAVFISPTFFPILSSPDGRMLDSAIGERNDRDSKKSFYPDLDYWEIDPEAEGSRQKLIPPPPGAPLTAEGIMRDRGFQFTFGLDGLPKFPSIEVLTDR